MNWIVTGIPFGQDSCSNCKFSGRFLGDDICLLDLEVHDEVHCVFWEEDDGLGLYRV